MTDKIDILYIAWNRLQFTLKSFETMVANTDWSLVSRLVVYDDGSTDGADAYLIDAIRKFPHRQEVHFWQTPVRMGPVGIMRRFLVDGGAPIFAKVDNDTMLPPGWLNECLAIIEDKPEIDLLGIEARIDVKPSGPPPRTTYRANHIGGIGLMRRRAFTDLPMPNSEKNRFGFTEWQHAHPAVIKAWLHPPLPVCLLNLVPFEPWCSLSRCYIEQGWQRNWPEPYAETRTDLWGWWAVDRRC